MTEVWKPVVGFEAYEVSNQGRVRRVLGGQGAVAGKVLTWHTNTSTGYPTVRLTKNGKAVGINVHKLVSRAFLGPKPDGLVTRHLDGNKLNNCDSNLVYGTPSENAQDKNRHGTASGWHKLSPSDVVDIRTANSAGVPVSALASAYSVSESHVFRIVGFRARKLVPQEASGRAMDRGTR